MGVEDAGCRSMISLCTCTSSSLIFSPCSMFSVLQVNLNDSHNQMVVHWAGEKSNVIVALARDSAGATGPKTSSVSSTHPCMTVIDRYNYHNRGLTAH